MKSFKLFIGLMLVVLMTGCGTKGLEKYYDNMEIGSKGIKGYVLELRIYGNKDNDRINEIVRITNYNNVDFKIVKRNVSQTNINPFEEDDIEETTYIKNDKVYKANESGTYVETKDDINYKKPSIYLEGLNNIVSIDKGESVTIGEKKYTLYKTTFSKTIMNDIVADNILKETKITKDVEGEVYIDSEGYVYRIIYKLDNVTINANYFNINKINSIVFPSEIE